VNPSDVRSVVLAGGGTAGHVNPLLAVADELRRREPATRLLVLGTATGLEADLVPARGYELRQIPRVPLPRRPSTDLLRLPGRLTEAVRAAEAAIDEIGAQAVVGFGGYVSTPAYLAARRRGVPVVIHEANARPGLANRLGSRWAAAVGTTFPGTTLAGATCVGLPAVYVPLPVGNGEQRLNATGLVEAGGGLLVDDVDLTPRWVATQVPVLLRDTARLTAMATAARGAGVRDAAARMADMVGGAAGWTA
jgi:UDP-N-acetylglucosamine:LPS N-acetylglucosamine transferase